MEPEIARRCLNCGASVRGRAHFCPQCGRPMGEGEVQEHAPVAPRAQAHPLAEEAERVAAALSGKLSDAPPADAESSFDNRARAFDDEAARTPVLTPDAATARAATATAGAQPEAAPEADEADDADDDNDVRADGGAAARVGEQRGGVRGRAAAVGASVGESLKPRVERLREASSVVIDEATDDPGVRFLVVAAVLFLLFLLLWLFSYTLG